MVTKLLLAITLLALTNAFAEKDTNTITRRDIVRTLMNATRTVPVSITWNVRILKEVISVFVTRATERKGMNVKVGALFLFLFNQ